MLSFRDMDLLEALGAACLEVRAGRRLGFVQVHLPETSDMTERTLDRFEKGEVQNREIPAVLEAYSVAFNVPLPEILRLTAKHLEGDSARVERGLKDVARATRKAPAGTARKRGVKPK